MAKRKSKKTIPRKQMLDRYARLYSGPIYDVMAKMGYPDQVLSHEITPLSRGLKIAGPALTLQGVAAVPGSVTPADDYFGSLCKACTPGCVGVYSMGKEQLSGHWGELTSTSVKAHGCQGVVIDGGARDSDLIEQLGFKVFCRYTSPIEMATRACFISCQKPVYMPGSLTAMVTVRPNDWVFGDGDGVTIIPKEIAVDVLIQAEEMAEREARGRELFATGMDPRDVIRKYHVG